MKTKTGIRMKDEKNDEIFHCKKCSKEIGGHNQYLHDSMCDDCFFGTYFPDD